MRKEQETVKTIRELEEVFIPVTVVGELYYGAFKSKKIMENLKNISELLNIITVLDNDAETARIYGDLKSKLKEKGRPIPDNDIWIAAVAVQYKLRVIISDQHFETIENLQLIIP